MAKSKVIAKEPFYGKSKTKAGKPAKIGTKITNADGEVKVLLTPAGKGAKYASELKNGKHYTNSGAVKRDEKGKPLELTKEQRIYRMAYLTSRADSAKAYNAKKSNRPK